jgi:hypothetical protein
MMHRRVSWSGLALAAIMAVSPLVTVAQQATPVSNAGDIGSAKVIGMEILPNDLMVDDTLVGGLSSIDYNPQTGQWIAISDDRSWKAPSRFYTVNIDYSATSLNSVTIEKEITLLQADGTPYPGDADGGNVADIESVRFDPLTGLIWYGTEAETSLRIPPWLAVSTIDGQFVSQPALPSMFNLDPEGIAGPRNNQGFEAMSFSADGNTIWLGLENGLSQDGPLATRDQGSTTRISQIDRSGHLLQQFAYELEPLGVETPGYFDTGLSEILAVDDTHFLTLERSTVQDANGVFNNYIRIFEIDISGATDVKGRTWLDGQEFTPLSKKLVLDLGTTGIELDNIEGMSWGPVLENGNRSLVLVSDNNFDDSQLTQFVAIEVAG